MRVTRLVALAVTVVVVALAAVALTGRGGEERRPRPARAITPAAASDSARALVARMTLDEKLAMTSGLFVDERLRVELPGVDRLGIPPVLVTDGPAGITAAGVPGGATALPAPLALAATFSPSLSKAYGDVLGGEAKAAGAGMLFGPELNLARDPRGGRAFETFGEDPALASALAAPLVRSVQAHAVIATPKHFVANDQERWRMRLRQRVGQRALRELYLPPFEAALNAGAGALMAAYPSVNGAFMTANSSLLAIPRAAWGWRGAVVSDYFATHSAVTAMRAGLDLELPIARFYGEPLRQAVLTGRIPEADIDRAAERLLRAMLRAGLIGSERRSAARAPDGARTARVIAAAGTVLLKNRHGTLPLPAGLSSLAVIGPGAQQPAAGLGSAEVRSRRGVSLLDALRKALPHATVTRAATWRPDDLPPVPPGALRGLRGRYHDNPWLHGRGIARRKRRGLDLAFAARARSLGLSQRPWSARWHATLVGPETGEYELGTLASGGVRVRLGGKLLLDGGAPGDVDMHPPRPESVRVRLHAGRGVPLTVEYVSPSVGSPSLRLWWLTPSELAIRAREAAAAAAHADAAVVAVRDWSGEGGDRATLRLPGGQEQLIQAVARANRRTVVVLQTGGPVELRRWIADVPAVLEGWYPGEQGGPALADVLLGHADPGGRLPVTFPRRLADTPTARGGRYPGERPLVRYGEGLLIGFRWYDSRRIRPAYPFGFGRSYARFRYRGLAIHGPRVSFSVLNHSDRPGTAVPQVYVRLPGAGEPLRLAAFARASLAPGRATRVSVTLPPRSLQVWRHARWIRPPGRVAVTVRTDARTVALAGRL